MENFTLPDLWIALLLPLLLLGVWWMFYRELRDYDARPRHATPDDRRHPCAVHPTDMMVLPRSRGPYVTQETRYQLPRCWRSKIAGMPDGTRSKTRDKMTLIASLVGEFPDTTHEELQEFFGPRFSRSSLVSSQRRHIADLLRTMQDHNILEKV